MPERSRLERLRQQLDVPAVGAAIVTPDTTEVAVVGVTARGGTEPAEPEHTWHIGSCTKALTAAVYAVLVQRDIASWDAPVGELLADVSPHPAWSQRTVSELLWCRAGVAANLPIREIRTWAADERPLPQQRTDAAARALAGAPRRPGRFRYSNLGYIVVGAVIDRLAGSWEEALRRELLEPAGVGSPGYGAPRQILGHRARWTFGPFGLGRGRPVPPTDPRADNPPVLSSAGTLHLTLADWAALQRVFHADVPGPLSAESIATLVTEPPMPGRGMAMGWAVDREGRVGAQGSNTLWSATALQSQDRLRTALVVADDGRPRVLLGTYVLATELLDA